jgi:polyhydroxyalkanoate synthesis regulator phasin
MATIGMLVVNPHERRSTMTRVDDMRKAFEATIGNLSTTRAQELAKGFLEPGAAKEQVAKTAADLMEWSQRNRQRLRSEIKDQMRQMGLATQDELDALRKRVRELERAAGMTASGGRRAPAKTSAKRTSSKKTAAKKTSTSGNA